MGSHKIFCSMHKSTQCHTSLVFPLSNQRCPNSDILQQGNQTLNLWINQTHFTHQRKKPRETCVCVTYFWGQVNSKHNIIVATNYHSSWSLFYIFVLDFAVWLFSSAHLEDSNSVQDGGNCIIEALIVL